MVYRNENQLREPLLHESTEQGHSISRQGSFSFQGYGPTVSFEPLGQTGDAIADPSSKLASSEPSWKKATKYANDEGNIAVSARGRAKRKIRNPIQNKSFVKRAAHTATHHPSYFFANLVWGLILWPKWSWEAMRANWTLTVLSLKSGISAGLASVLCVVPFPAPYTGLSSIAIWAVVTTSILYEGNIGLSLSKGVNRVAGTLSAGFLAVVLTQLGPDIPDIIYPYFVVFFVFLGGAVFRFLKGIPPLKEQWGYAFTVATIAFHILLIGSYQHPEKVTLPLLRFLMILLGFFFASVVNLAFQPVYAGDTLHKLVAKNFETAGSVLLRCVTEYNNFTQLDHVPDILSGRSEDDKIHQSYHEIVMSDSDIDKLLNAVNWEPCHGPFFIGYPWHLYDDITDYLRYTLYDVIALDSCLRASVQAPKHLRDLFAQDMGSIAHECAAVLNMLAACVRDMRKFPSEDILAQAEQSAVSLQYKIYIHTHLLLGKGAAESPRYGYYVASCQGRNEFSPETIRLHNFAPNNSKTEDGTLYRSRDEKLYGSDKIDDEYDRLRARIDSELGSYNKVGDSMKNSVPIRIPGTDGTQSDPQRASSWGVNDRCGGKEIDQLAGSPSIVHFPEGSLGQRGSSNVIYGSMGATDFSVEHREEKKPPVVVNLRSGSVKDWRQNFRQRKSSLGHNWDGSLERISALSLVKFASLLIEIVTKMSFVVDSVAELSQAAKFKEIFEDHHTGRTGFLNA